TRFSRDWSSDVCSSDLDGDVEQRVGGPGVVGEHVPGADDGDVRDPAEVERRRGALAVGEDERVEVRGERRAVPAGGDVARPHVEIGRASWRGGGGCRDT